MNHRVTHLFLVAVDPICSFVVTFPVLSSGPSYMEGGSVLTVDVRTFINGNGGVI